MDFLELQRSWQQQSAPTAEPGPAAGPAHLLAETQRLHRFGRRRNLLATLLITLSLLCFLSAQLIQSGPRVATEHWGVVLLNVVMVAFISLVWWGTSLRSAATPSLDSRAYVQASLRAFRFRAWAVKWLSVPYAALLGVGLALVQWRLLHVVSDADWWKPAFLVGLCVGAVLIGRRVALRKYEKEFGSAVRELEQWEAAWQEKK